MVISELDPAQRTTHPRPARTLVTSVLAVVLGAGLAGPSGAVDADAEAGRAPEVRLSLGDLDRGEPPAVPFMTIGGRLVHGDTDLHVNGHGTTLLGEFDGTYVYSRSDRRGRYKDVRRVTPEGTVTEVTSIKGAEQVVLSEDGQWLAVVKPRRKDSLLRVVSVTTGNDTLDTTLDIGWANLLDVDAEQVVVSSWSQRGTWSVPMDIHEPVTRLSKRIGYLADIAANRLATYTKDPYRDGCSVVSRLSRPRRTLTRSCTERAGEFSETGARVANVFLLSDGIGPSEVTVRRASGKKVADYLPPYYFGQFMWEDDRNLLLHVYNRRRSALVRCEGADCEIAVPDLGKPLARALTPAGARTPR